MYQILFNYLFIDHWEEEVKLSGLLLGSHSAEEALAYIKVAFAELVFILEHEHVKHLSAQFPHDNVVHLAGVVEEYQSQGIFVVVL